MGALAEEGLGLPPSENDRPVESDAVAGRRACLERLRDKRAGRSVVAPGDVTTSDGIVNGLPSDDLSAVTGNPRLRLVEKRAQRQQRDLSNRDGDGSSQRSPVPGDEPSESDRVVQSDAAAGRRACVERLREKRAGRVAKLDTNGQDSCAELLDGDAPGSSGRSYVAQDAPVANDRAVETDAGVGRRACLERIRDKRAGRAAKDSSLDLADDGTDDNQLGSGAVRTRRQHSDTIANDGGSASQQSYLPRAEPPHNVHTVEAGATSDRRACLERLREKRSACAAKDLSVDPSDGADKPQQRLAELKMQRPQLDTDVQASARSPQRSCVQMDESPATAAKVVDSVLVLDRRATLERLQEKRAARQATRSPDGRTNSDVNPPLDDTGNDAANRRSRLADVKARRQAQTESLLAAGDTEGAPARTNGLVDGRAVEVEVNGNGQRRRDALSRLQERRSGRAQDTPEERDSSVDAALCESGTPSSNRAAPLAPTLPPSGEPRRRLPPRSRSHGLPSSPEAAGQPSPLSTVTASEEISAADSACATATAHPHAVRRQRVAEPSERPGVNTPKRTVPNDLTNMEAVDMQSDLTATWPMPEAHALVPGGGHGLCEGTLAVNGRGELGRESEKRSACPERAMKKQMPTQSMSTTPSTDQATGGWKMSFADFQRQQREAGLPPAQPGSARQGGSRSSEAVAAPIRSASTDRVAMDRESRLRRIQELREARGEAPKCLPDLDAGEAMLTLLCDGGSSPQAANLPNGNGASCASPRHHLEVKSSATCPPMDSSSATSGAWNASGMYQANSLIMSTFGTSSSSQAPAHIPTGFAEHAESSHCKTVFIYEGVTRPAERLEAPPDNNRTEQDVADNCGERSDSGRSKHTTAPPVPAGLVATDEALREMKLRWMRYSTFGDSSPKSSHSDDLYAEIQAQWRQYRGADQKTGNVFRRSELRPELQSMCEPIAVRFELQPSPPSLYDNPKQPPRTKAYAQSPRDADRTLLSGQAAGFARPSAVVALPALAGGDMYS